MAWYHEVAATLRALLRRDHQEREMAEELRTHIEMERQYNMRQGLSPDESNARATRAFGSVERYKDEVRDERGSRWFDELRQDLRFGWVSLRRRSGFTAS